ncbi:hypothetical protein [Bradyrhizobium sp. UFLA03-84]|uniref:hypothetical protein n=2 Tax=Bradyrhizobium TaxID=374 RepID=UPI000AD2F0A2|nr:hypothetical protein [Bradyrhizobium sp. UFLA03-84]
MPYIIVIAAFGGFGSATLAFLATHSFALMIPAAIPGIVFGLALAAVALRQLGLPLGANFADYRSAAGMRAINQVTRRFLNIALTTAVVVSIVEFTGQLAGLISIFVTLPAGIAVIVVYTLYRCWQVSDPGLLGRLDVVLIASCIGAVLLTGFLLYSFMTRTPDWDMSASDVFRLLSVVNCAAALAAAMLAVLCIGFVHRWMGPTGASR